MPHLIRPARNAGGTPGVHGRGCTAARIPTSARPADVFRAAAGDDGAVGLDIAIRVTGTGPPRGEVVVGRRTEPFTGWLQLLALLSGVLEPDGPGPPAGPDPPLSGGPAPPR